MEVLGRPVSPEIEALRDEVVSVAPNSGLTFLPATAGEDLEEEIHGGACRLLRDGSHEIYLADDFDETTLAHELLHALMDRQGFPRTECLVGFSNLYLLAASMIANAAQHAVLYAEADRRGLSVSKWPETLESMSHWNLSPEPDPTSDGGMHNVRKVAEVVASCPLDSSAALQNVRVKFPATYAMGLQIGAITSRLKDASHAAFRRAMVEILETLEAAVLKGNPRALSPRYVIMVGLVLSAHQLKQPADRTLEVGQIDNRSIVGVFRKQDHTLLAVMHAHPSTPATIHRLREDLKKSDTRTFLNKHRIACYEVTA